MTKNQFRFSYKNFVKVHMWTLILSMVVRIKQIQVKKLFIEAEESAV